MLDLQSIYFGQKHPEFNYSDYDIIRKIKRLYHKHHRQCENDCNGEGYIKGVFYRCNNDKAYIGDNTVFYVEIIRLETKINALLAGYDKETFKVEFQHDPRGYTVKLYYEGELIEW